MAKVVVIGGGYAGLACLIELAKKAPKTELSLIDGRALHCKITNLHKTFAQPVADFQVPFAELAERFGFAFHRHRLNFTAADLISWQQTKKLPLADRELAFDWLVVCTGSHPLLQSHSTDVHDISDLQDGRGPQLLERWLSEAKTRRIELSFVGAGATGLQVLFELQEQLRSKRGLSQTDLAKLVGVTPSTISQVESNLIYPSLPALLKMAEILAVEVSSFFQEKANLANRVIFSSSEAVDIKFPDLPDGSIHAKLLTPVDFEAKAEPFILEIPAHQTLPGHFFIHRGEEIGYLLSGKLQLKLEKSVSTARSGDVIYLTSAMPSQWKNPGPGIARLLWIKIK